MSIVHCTQSNRIFLICSRYLDGASLLNVAKSSKKLMSICRGDPVLRQRLQEELKREIEARRRFVLDPRASVTVRRQQKSGPFQRNAVKQVKRSQEKCFGGIEDLWTTKRTAGGKMRTIRTRPNVRL